MSQSQRQFEIVGEVRTWQLRKQRVLGKGSFGLATLCECVDTGELVVVKEMNLQCITKPAEIQALHSEITILKKTSSHPNIVKYFDSCFDGQFSMVIVMEFCDDGDLAGKIEEAQSTREHISEQFIASILIQVLAGLAYLHLEHHVLHRDLKPQNIFLTKHGVAKIGDFGVSTMLSQSVDFAKTFCGSPYYLAPELCEERPYNGKADLWSVGVILYELMSRGDRPFHGKTLVALILAITRCDYMRLGDDSGYSREFRDLVHSLLQQNPTARPTIKRLLRSPVVLSNLHNLPDGLLGNEFYLSVFSSSPIARAKAQQRALAAGAVAVHSAEQEQMMAEIEAWAAKEGSNPDDQILSSLSTLPPGRPLANQIRTAGPVQVSTLPSTSSPPRPLQPPPKLSATAQPLNEDAWNALYENDTFEDDDDEGPVVEPGIPVSAIGYKI